MQKPTRPGHSKLSVLGSTGSKKAIERAQVGLYLGTYVRRGFASTVELSAHCRSRWGEAEMLLPPSMQER